MNANARECNVWICPAPERVVQVRVYWRQLAATHLNSYCFSRASERSSYFGPSKRNSRCYLCGQKNKPFYLESAPMVNGENIRIDGGAHAGAKW